MNEIDWSARPIDLKQKYLAKRYTSYLITVKEVISSLSRVKGTLHLENSGSIHLHNFLHPR